MKKSGFNGDIRRDIIGAYSVLDGGLSSFHHLKRCPLTGITDCAFPWSLHPKHLPKNYVMSFSTCIVPGQLLGRISGQCHPANGVCLHSAEQNPY